jgi:uncharacterized membrane protein (DUF485 family)
VQDEKLRSLGVFLDVVFALVFFRIVEFLPSFQDGHWMQLPHGILSLLASQPANLTRVVFGVIITAYYWNRKNTFLSLLTKSNAVIAALSITILCFFCLFMYSLIADPTYVGGAPTLLLQSVSLLIASLLGFLAFRYAIHANLVRPELRVSAEQTARVDLSNPLTAAVATCLSWSGLTIWTLSWFIVLPLFAWLLGRGKRATGGPHDGVQGTRKL